MKPGFETNPGALPTLTEAYARRRMLPCSAVLAETEGRRTDIFANPYQRFACTPELGQQAWAKTRGTPPLRRLRLSYGTMTSGSSIWMRPFASCTATIYL